MIYLLSTFIFLLLFYLIYKKGNKNSLFYIVIFALILFFITKANWIYALLLAAIPLIRKIFLIISYLPIIRKLYSGYINRSNNKSYKIDTGMSKSEALEILDIKDNASKDEIIQAYKKAMLKNHPDRGGSKYMATKINLAKKILLG